MDKERAKEIMNLPQNIYVTYQNLPVWIDEVKDNEQVEIRDFNSNLKMDVPVDDLVEVEGIENRTSMTNY